MGQRFVDHHTVGLGAVSASVHSSGWRWHSSKSSVARAVRVPYIPPSSVLTMSGVLSGQRFVEHPRGWRIPSPTLGYASDRYVFMYVSVGQRSSGPVEYGMISLPEVEVARDS